MSKRAKRSKIHSYTPRMYCGTSNIVLPVPNKTHFPPQYQDKTRLHYYATIFNSLEVNSSFYKIPLGRTVQKWSQDVPGSFLFTFKLWKNITHAKDLQYDPADISRFLNAIGHVGSKKGCLLIQFPASIKFSFFHKVSKLIEDIKTVPGADKWRLALEFRDPSWYNDRTYQLLEQNNATVVFHDMPKSTTPFVNIESSFIFLRFHGPEAGYRGSYSRYVLQEQAAAIKDWTDAGKNVFVYFNNTLGAAVHNALDLSAYWYELIGQTD